MRRGRAAWTVTAALMGALLLSAGAHAAGGPADVAVTVDRNRISASLGQKVAFRSTVVNRGSTAASGLIAHLNVLSVRKGVYVDPEDWSSNRTRYLDTIPAGGSTAINWQIQAVNAGILAVYVSVLRHTAVGRRPVNGPAVQLAVAQRKTLNSGGILPLALGLPALLGALSLGLMFRRRG
jgi:hypothetical protein